MSKWKFNTQGQIYQTDGSCHFLTKVKILFIVEQIRLVWCTDYQIKLFSSIVEFLLYKKRKDSIYQNLLKVFIRTPDLRKLIIQQSTSILNRPNETSLSLKDFYNQGRRGNWRAVKQSRSDFPRITNWHCSMYNAYVLCSGKFVPDQTLNSV